MLFWSKTADQKLLNTQCCVHRCTCKSPIMKWAKALKEASKKHTAKPSTASHNTTSWYTDTDGFLEHSSSRGSLPYKGASIPEDNSRFFGFRSYRFIFLCYLIYDNIPCTLYCNFFSLLNIL